VELTLVLAVALVTLVVFALPPQRARHRHPQLWRSRCRCWAPSGDVACWGYSVNNLSLMALTISTGFVVDDAIVVTENIRPADRGGTPPPRPPLRGRSTSASPSSPSPVSLLAVFIPNPPDGRPIGRMFREFAVTLAVAIAMSALVSLTLTPMMCSRLLRRGRRAGGGGGTAAPSGGGGRAGRVRARAGAGCWATGC